MKEKHTPGPWDDASKYPEIPTVRIFAKAHYIASVGNSDDSREQTEANARLIASAPELLAACKEFVRKCDCGEAESTRSYAQMKAAIAKAEGL